MDHPRLVNTHGHIGSSLLRGNGDDLPLQEWLKQKCGQWNRNLQKKRSQLVSLFSDNEMLKSGTTTFLEMYHIHLDIIAQLVSDSGIRSVICRGMIDYVLVAEQEKN
ncbi:amidohydrolase family protein [Anaerobacillus sp. HL2]|nr:amidohydrolase family protein [Anaerobacillus sp. HL2]